MIKILLKFLEEFSNSNIPLWNIEFLMAKPLNSSRNMEKGLKIGIKIYK